VLAFGTQTEEETMQQTLRTLLATAMLVTMPIAVSAQTETPAAERDYEAEALDYLKKAKSAARASRHFGLLNSVCVAPRLGTNAPLKNVPHRTITDPRKIPDFRVWSGEPAKIFDQMYFVGGKEHSAWVLDTGEGYILIDTIYPYNSTELIIDGMGKLGLDPAEIKYIIISHGHSDHIGGVEAVQAVSGAPVVMGEGDWKLVETYPVRYTDMTPDFETGIRVSERMDLTLGDVTIDIMPTPGHTPGTLGMVFTVTDFGKPVTIAYNGGTSMTFPNAEPEYGLPNVQEFIDSVETLATAAKEAGATVLMTNHSIFDNAYTNARLVAQRGFGEHPFVRTEKDVANYFAVLENCAKVVYTNLEEKQSLAN